MSYYHHLKKLSRARQSQLEDTTKRVNRVIHRQGTHKKTLSDFPEVNRYITDKFPDVNVGDIPIYMVTEPAMNANGFSGVGGFYVHHMRVVVVKKKIVIGNSLSKKKFDKVLEKLIKIDADPEDIIVHEMIHAVSGESNRSNRRFTYDEEEFVYTNSIDFYKNKGMTSDDIVNQNFIPFCIQDIFNNTKELEGILSSLSEEYNMDVPTIDASLTNEKFNRFLGRNAEKVVPILVDRAREIGFHMISLYDEFGRGVGAVSQPRPAAPSTRFQTISFDDDDDAW